MVAVVWSVCVKWTSVRGSNLADAGWIHLNTSQTITMHHHEWMWVINQEKNADDISLIPALPPQVSSMDFMALKRSQLYGMANNPYSAPQQPGGGPYPPSQPYTSPPPHRYPMSMQGRGQMSMGGMQYPQQQVCQRTQTLRLCICTCLTVACEWVSPLCSAIPDIVAGIISDIAVGRSLLIVNILQRFSPEGLACSIWDAA